jgi:two-component system KDP operon response regulator KdpE
MTTSSRVVLVIEDDAKIRDVLRMTLELDSYRVIEAENGERGLVAAQSHRPDLAVIDLGLPDIDGVQVIKRIRDWTRMPIVVLSARTQEEEKVLALESGADDYVTKPFGARELLARVRVALRHSVQSSNTPGPSVRIGKWHIDLEKRDVHNDVGKSLHLTPIEFRLLEVLAKHSGMVVTHRQLLLQGWGPGSLDQTHYVRGYIKQLREKLETDPIRPEHLLTETGVGYRLVLDDPAQSPSANDTDLR